MSIDNPAFSIRRHKPKIIFEPEASPATRTRANRLQNRTIGAENHAAMLSTRAWSGCASTPSFCCQRSRNRRTRVGGLSHPRPESTDPWPGLCDVFLARILGKSNGEYALTRERAAFHRGRYNFGNSRWNAKSLHSEKSAPLVRSTFRNCNAKGLDENRYSALPQNQT